MINHQLFIVKRCGLLLDLTSNPVPWVVRGYRRFSSAGWTLGAVVPLTPAFGKAKPLRHSWYHPHRPPKPARAELADLCFWFHSKQLVTAAICIKRWSTTHFGGSYLGRSTFLIATLTNMDHKLVMCFRSWKNQLVQADPWHGCFSWRFNSDETLLAAKNIGITHHTGTMILIVTVAIGIFRATYCMYGTLTKIYP